LSPNAHAAVPEASAPVEEAGPVGDAWALAWENQSFYVQGIDAILQSLRVSLPDMAKNISLKLPGIETNARGLDLLAEQYIENPMALGAIHKRYLVLRNDLRRVLANGRQARAQLDELLPKLVRFEETMSNSTTSQDKTRNQEFAALLKQVNQLKQRLLETNNRIAGMLTPGEFLEQRLTQTSVTLRQALPERWLDYYASHSRFFMPASWESIEQEFVTQMDSLQLRLPAELPVGAKAWLSVAPRFLNIFVFGGLFLFLLHWRLRRNTESEYSHMFTNSLPWICLGLAFYAASWESREERYLGLIIPGTLAFIWGQLSLAWDLRRVNFPDSPRISPLGSIFPLLALGSVIILLDPPAPVQSIVWLAGLIPNLIIKRRRIFSSTMPRLERSILHAKLVLTWLTLFIALFGWTRISILCYLLFITFVVGLNLAMGCITTLHKLSSRIPEEGAASLIGGLLFSCAFPMVLALVIIGMFLCVISCPGGLYLIQPYLSTSVSMGGVTVDLFLLLMILGAFYLTRAVISAGRAFIRRLPESGLDSSLMTPLQTGFSYGLWMLFALLILKVLGVDTEKLAIVAGGFSVGIGFGMQAIVNNLISGLILIFSRTLREGDVVEVGGLTGTVRTISIRATTVETFDNAIIFVPNSEFISTRLINWTRNSRMVRREITVGVAYGTDTKLVQRLLLEAASNNTRVLKYPKPVAFFMGFGASTLDFSLRFWVNDYNDGLSISSDLRSALSSVFALHKVDVAFQQLDVHLKNIPITQKTMKAPAEAKRARQAPPSTRAEGRRLPLRKPRRPVATSPQMKPEGAA
jgi:small-conductance mechanosensitive channel